jgi:ABC-type amino acid transport substrate-binding protein
LSLEELRYVDYARQLRRDDAIHHLDLPGLVAALTPVPPWILPLARRAAERSRRRLRRGAALWRERQVARPRLRRHKDDAEAVADVIVPASSFPHTGKILSLSFLLFIGWFMGEGVPVTEYPRLATSGLLVMFGSANAAIPFLLDMLRLPSDAFRLFVTSGLVNARFGTLVAAVHTLVVAILGTCAVLGVMRIDARKLMRFGVVTVLVVAGAIAGTRLYLQASVDPTYQMSTMLTGRSLLSHRADARVFKQGEEVAPTATGGSVLDRVRGRGVLRVGYFDDSLPYAFFNSRGELVGFDVEMAYELARNLGVVPEFVPVSRSIFDKGLDPAVCDVLMSGIVLTIDRAAHVQFSASCLDETVGFVVPVTWRRNFSDWSSVREMGRLPSAPARAVHVRRIRDELKDVESCRSHVLTVFVPRATRCVAMTAERGSAYTLLPGFQWRADATSAGAAGVCDCGARHRDGVDSEHGSSRSKDGAIDRLFAYWILRQEEHLTRRRWSSWMTCWGGRGESTGASRRSVVANRSGVASRFSRHR